MGLDVALVGDGDDGSYVCVFEDEVDQRSHGFGAQPNALRITGNGEADLGLSSSALTQIPASPISSFVERLAIPSWTQAPPGEEVYLAHLLNEPPRLMVRLRFPALVPADLWIMSIRLKPGKIGVVLSGGGFGFSFTSVMATGAAPVPRRGGKLLQKRWRTLLTTLRIARHGRR
jgi:hypothetical protein